MALEVLLEEGLKTVLKKGIKLAGGAIAGGAATFTDLLYKVADKKTEEIRDKVRDKLHCAHVELPPEY